MILFQNRLIDREEAVVDIEDRGYQFGDGVYEVIRVYDGALFGFAEHLERLERSTSEVRIELPMSMQEIEKKLVELVEANNLKTGIIYLQITRGAAPRTHHFPEQSESVLTAYTKELDRPVGQINNGIHALLKEDIRWLRCDIKSLNLLANVMAKQDAKEHACTEAIFHRGETVTEGSSSNVLIINGNELRTHPANNLILNGITKNKVFELAQELGIDIRQEAFTTDELLNAEEAFITSTTAEITPVVQIGDRQIGNGQSGPVTRKLQKAFEQSISKASYVETN